MRGHFKLLEIDEKPPGQWQQTMEVTLVIESEPNPSPICAWITQFLHGSLIEV